jgi:tetratricopeptide (TPR) repeat protein
VKSVPAPAPEQPIGAAKTLQEAEQTYSSRELDKSKALFLKVLEQTEKKSIHASAYYGLARIALIQKDLDTAERLFQKSLESEPEAFDKAWDLVYLGRLAIGAGDRDRAISYFEAVLKLEGATEKARQEARQGLDLTKKP